MWARILEVMIACWLAASRFIFRYEDPFGFWHVNDLVCAFFIALFAFLSFHQKLGKMHLFTFLIVIWLFVLNYSHGYPLPNMLQNYQVIAFLLLMIALIPSHAQLPPKPWRDYILKRKSIL